MRKHGIKSDARIEPGLREQIQTLRGSMMEAAEAAPLPARFIATADPSSPAVVIKDRETGRVATVPLCSYGDVRRTLFALFGGGK